MISIVFFFNFIVVQLDLRYYSAFSPVRDRSSVSLTAVSSDCLDFCTAPTQPPRISPLYYSLGI